MKYIDHGRGGDADVLQLAERDMPEVGAGEVLIRVAYAGVNRPDVLQRMGSYPPPRGASPWLGLEVAGVVAASVVYVAGVALAAPAMISLYGQVSAPNRGSGMALNGFILFVGTSAGPLLATSSPTFRTLALTLTGILTVALLAITGFKALADADH